MYREPITKNFKEPTAQPSLAQAIVERTEAEFRAKSVPTLKTMKEYLLSCGCSDENVKEVLSMVKEYTLKREAERVINCNRSRADFRNRTVTIHGSITNASIGRMMEKLEDSAKEKNKNYYETHKEELREKRKAKNELKKRGLI